MSSTLNDVRAAIEQRFELDLSTRGPTGEPPYAIAYANVPFTPPNNIPWVQITVNFGDNAYATLLGPSTGFNRQNGTLVVNIFTSVGSGAGANLTIAERIKDLFDRAKFSSIIFDAASGPSQVTPASPEPYYQTQLTATFEAYLD